jgi:hypothetical protein
LTGKPSNCVKRSSGIDRGHLLVRVEMRSSSAHSRDFSSARGAVRAFFYAFPQVSIRPPISAGMNDKKPLQIILGSALHAESQSVGLAVAALR